MSAFPVTIWHNPSCGSSRKALAMIEEAGHQPEVIDYLRTGWERSELMSVLAAGGLSPRQVLRESAVSESQSALLQPGVSDEALIEAMIAHPALVNRPLVRTPKGVRLGRPPETVREIL